MAASEELTRRPQQLWFAAIAITAVIAALLVMDATLEYRSAAMRVGFMLDDSSGELLISSVDHDLPAEKAGIEPGDVIVGLNGSPIQSIRDYDRAMKNFTPGQSIRFSIQRDGETIPLSLEPGAGFPWIRYISTFGPVLAYLVLGLLCLLHWRQDIRARLLAILVLAIAVELAMPIYAIGHPTLTAAGEAVYFLLTGIQIGVELHLISLIPARAPWLKRWPSLAALFYLIGLGMATVLAAGTVIDFLTPGRSIPWPSEVGYDVVDWALPIWAIAIGAMLSYQMIRYPNPRGRQQAGLVLVGVAPWIIFTLVETGASIFGIEFGETWYNLTNWALTVFPIAVFVAIFRYHLFDLELVVRRTLVFGSIMALLIGVLYAMLAAAWPLAAKLFGETGAAWTVTGLALGLGVLASRMRAELERAIERRVFPERHALRGHLIRLAASLPVRGKLPLMGAHLTDELCLAFRVQSSAIVMVDPRSQLPYTLATARMEPDAGNALAGILRTDPRLEKRLTENRKPLTVERLKQDEAQLRRLRLLGVEVIAPLISHDDFIGALCLGRKQSGSDFPAEELELLNLLSHHVVTAFENARLTEHATYEGLTGLYRREVILDILERECGRAIQCNDRIAVAMIDIDQFKSFNDDHGHLAGDLILQRVARTLQSELRTTDLVGRYGGEEFLAVLPSTDLEGARIAAEHMRTGIEMLSIPLESGVMVKANVSVGLAAVDVAEGRAEDLARAMIETADQYLYEAKQQGRNRVIAGPYSLGVA